jgi:hypothetical protein
MPILLSILGAAIVLICQALGRVRPAGQQGSPHAGQDPGPIHDPRKPPSDMAAGHGPTEAA